MELNFDELMRGLLSGPSPEERSRAMNMGILQAGLGLLARKNIGEAGMLGVQAGQGMLDKSIAERKSTMQNAAQLMALKKQMDQQKALSGLFAGDGEQRTQAAQGALAAGAEQGDIGPTVTNAARIPQQPFSSRPFEAALAGGVNPEVVKTLLELRNPKMEVSSGYAFNPRTVQSGFIPQFQFNKEGQGVLAIPGANGLPMVSNAPGSLEAKAAQIANEKRAEQPYTLVDVPNSAGGTVKMPANLAFPILSNNARAMQPTESPAATPTAPVVTPSATTPNPAQSESQDTFPPLPYAEVIKHPAFLKMPQAERDSFIAQYGAKPSGLANLTPAASVLGRTQNAKEEADAAARKEFLVSDAKSRAEMYSKMQSSAMANQAKIFKYEQIGKLLENYSGGKLAKTGMELSRLGTSLGINIDPKLPNKEAAEALASEAALDLRNTADGVTMPGAMSDQDRIYLKSMVPQLAQTDAGRNTIINLRVSLWKREQEVANMARKYKQKYGDINEDFFTQLQAWSDRNPIFGGK